MMQPSFILIQHSYLNGEEAATKWRRKRKSECSPGSSLKQDRNRAFKRVVSPKSEGSRSQGLYPMVIRWAFRTSAALSKV